MPTSSPHPDRRRPDRPPRRVTQEQRRTLAIVAGLTLIHGHAPDLGELAQALAISKPSAFERLHWMAKKGLYCSRGKRLTPSGLEHVVAELHAGALAQPPPEPPQR